MQLESWERSTHPMPFNFSGFLAPFQVLVRPKLVIPSLAVKGSSRLCHFMRVLIMPLSQTDIRHIDFAALHREGYRAIVFDKDNCLVGLPHLALLTMLTVFLFRRYPTRTPSFQRSRLGCRVVIGR